MIDRLEPDGAPDPRRKTTDEGVAPVSPQGSSTATRHRVMVPVFVEVEIDAEDDLQAEVRSVALVRNLPGYRSPEGATISFRSVIAPMVSGQ